MAAEPLRSNSCHFLQRSRFFKQMGRTWNNDQFLVGTVELRQSFSVHTDHGFVVPSDDQKRGGANSIESVFRKIWPTSAGNDRRNDTGKLRSRHERSAGPSTGSKITHSKIRILSLRPRDLADVCRKRAKQIGT